MGNCKRIPRELPGDDGHPCDRRQFLGLGGAVAGAIAATSLLPGRALAGSREVAAGGAEAATVQAPAGFTPLRMPGKIVQVSHPQAMLALNRLNPPIVEKLVQEALRELTGAASPAEAMAKFIHKDDLVGLHVNCLGSPRMGTNPAVTFALVKALLEMGVPERNIIVYDQYAGRMKSVGYKLKDPRDGVKVLAHGMWGYERKPSAVVNGRPVHFCNILKRVTAVINLPVPKDHDLSGITGALKNMAFGNIRQVPSFHRGINRNVAELYNHPLIREKTRLIVTDALRCLYQGGPQDRGRHKAVYNSILASTDPVTTDVAILDIVNEHRRANRLKPIEEVRLPRRRPPEFIGEAAKLGLGENDRQKIQWVKKTLEG
jgi:uncharacterized protein (DUF362 family)